MSQKYVNVIDSVAKSLHLNYKRVVCPGPDRRKHHGASDIHMHITIRRSVDGSHMRVQM